MWGQNIIHGLLTNDKSALFHILMFFTCAKITINFYYTMTKEEFKQLQLQQKESGLGLTNYLHHIIRYSNG